MFEESGLFASFDDVLGQVLFKMLVHCYCSIILKEQLFLR